MTRGTPRLPVEELVAPEAGLTPPPGTVLGHSRQGRPIVGHRHGWGPLRVSLLAGCHADEPTGPATLRRLAAWLAWLGGDDPLLAAATWTLVPHANPDGEARNLVWSAATEPVRDSSGAEDRGYDPIAYARSVVRELPGDDVEFGFPRGPEDREARPENRAVAGFLAGGAPYALHGSLHGMGFAPGPWFLIEAAWIDRTTPLREALRRRTREMGYTLFDPDRGGEKGFHRIDEGFSTRPDSAAMRSHFEGRGDAETAALFRPSSMEHVRSLGGDPFTLVSEMPLFLLPEDAALPARPLGTEGRQAFHAWLAELIASHGPDGARAELAARGIRPMPIRDQMRLQLAFVNEALAAVSES